MINIGTFLSIASQLALQACGLIRDGSQNKDLKKYEKGVNDPVTQTDYKVQTMIISGLHKYFPNLRVIGQQTVKYQGQIKTDFQNLKSNFLPQNSKFESDIVNAQQLCVWIDPIDCTKGFIDGHLEHVTVLIGLSRKFKAYAGVVGVPFKNIKQERIYTPEITIGLVSTQQTFTYTAKEKWEKNMIQNQNNPFIFSTKSGLASGLFAQLIKFFEAQKIIAGGAGNKIMLVVRGQADLMCYLARCTCKWDSCAGQAVVKSLGGYFTDRKGDDLVYDPQDKNRLNSKGFICTMNKQIYQKSLKFVMQSDIKKQKQKEENDKKQKQKEKQKEKQAEKEKEKEKQKQKQT